MGDQWKHQLLTTTAHAPRASTKTRAIGDEITKLAGHINAAMYRFLMLIAEFDRRGGWSDGSTQSCAHYSKVRELTRVACPATEDYLLMIAIHGTAHHVERLVRYYRNAKESEELTREARQQKDRMLQYFYDHDGSVVIKARLPAQSGALFMKAIDQAVNDLWETEPDAVEPDTPAGTPNVKFLPTRTKRADALELLAESFHSVAPGQSQPIGDWRELPRQHEQKETVINARTAVTRWDGGPMDFGMAVGSLLHRLRNAKNPSRGELLPTETLSTEM